ncbi:ABC transporter ATP-binding protein [Sulfobacillus harzensis]|uniref:ABC transporter ATP-binding protein n=1 Tax=Sulfobacillus harzensis TaxID=2729629 RepID=A0A7Y0L2N0_9FIRM|nr:ABC transporter ATP-binding protein [Sulfobacillus harzensis]NMP22178.1 ABC transporter ATP-binding protein [Sulfobacillus harzensis]
MAVETQTEPLILVSDLTRKYGEGEAAVHALRGISLSIAAGEMVALMGPSGSGKSTLMNILGLFDRPSSGLYRLNGQDMTRLSARQQASYRGRRIAFVFQGIHLLPRLSALANVELPMSYARMGAGHRHDAAMHALELLGVAHLKDRYPSQMSGGQAQRVAIARAIAPGPDLLLADEPTGALDRKSGELVLQAFQQLHEETGVTIVIVTHDPVVGQHAARIVSLEDGQIIDDRPVTDRLRPQGGQS